MHTVEITHRALQNIDDIAAFSYANYGAAHTSAYVINLRKTLELIAENPTMGATRNGIAEGLRICPWKAHTIYYSFTPTIVVIHGVLHKRKIPEF